MIDEVSMVVKLISVNGTTLDDHLENFLCKNPEAVRTISDLRNILSLGDTPDFTLTKRVTESDIAAYQRTASVLSQQNMWIQASPFSYRRFDVRCDDERKYSLKTCSPLNPPRFFISLGPGARQVELPGYIFELPERRSLLIHRHLQEKGVPCATRPVACFTYIPARGMALYNGQLPVDAFMPIDVNIEEKTRNTRRVDFLTPEALEIAAAAKGMNTFDYASYLLQAMGKLHHQLHYLNGNECLLTAIVANKAVQEHFFKHTVPWHVSEGENPLHNTEVDLDSGNLFLTADFSDAVLLTTASPEEIKIGDELYISTKKMAISETAIEEARRTALAYFIDIAQVSRSLLYTLQHARVLSRDEYQKHIVLVDKRLDALQIKSSEKLHQHYVHELHLFREMMRQCLPWCTFSQHQLSDNTSISLPDGVHEETVQIYVSEFTRYYQLDARNVLDSITGRIRKGISEAKEIVKMLKDYPSILSKHNKDYELAVAEEEEAARALATSPVTERIFDLFMEGYKMT